MPTGERRPPWALRPAGHVNSRNQQRSDEDLARETQAGSLLAFEELVSRYERRIYGFVLQFCSNSTDAAEITQDTFVKAFRNIAQYNPRHAFPGWLFTIARHHCIDRYRAALPVSEAVPPEGADTADPAEVLASHEDKNSLWRLARRVLPSAQFQVIWLTYAESMRAREIARVMNRTTTHVKVMLFRARRTLRRALEESRPDFLAIEPTGTPARSNAAAGRRPITLRAMSRWPFPAEPAHGSVARKLGPIPGI
jgi:RNA polymerase sigma-70 factor, ECF subfamily